MTAAPDLIKDLRDHLTVCQDILSLTERENAALRDPAAPSPFQIYQGRKTLLPELEEKLDRLRLARKQWQQMSPAERTRFPGVPPLLRENQDLVMRIIVLDRENQRMMMGRGLVPAWHIPPAGRERPHFVADLYRRNRVN